MKKMNNEKRCATAYEECKLHSDKTRQEDKRCQKNQ